MVLTNLLHVPKSGSVSATAKQPLTDEQINERLASSFYISKEVAQTYRETLRAYKEESGVDFSSSTVLNTNTLEVLGKLWSVRTPVDPGILNSYKPMMNGKPINIPRPSIPELKTVSITDYLQTRVEDFNSRNEAWVRRIYSLKNTPDDQAFASKMVEDYQHLAKFTQKLIAALTVASDPASSKKPISSDLLNVLV